MDAKLVLMVTLSVSMLLLGCTNTPQQPAAQQPAQNPPAINARTGANVENPSVPAQQQKQYTCSLTLTPSTINAGGSTDIGFAVQSKENVKFTYNCGDEVREISTGGLTGGSRLCDFKTPGEIAVWIKADGVICAQKTLTVQQTQSARSCYIDQSSVKRDLSTYYYEARVQFTGFSPQDELVWICDRTTARQKLGGSQAGMPIYSEIYCDFAARPESSAIEVSIAGVSCGSISTR